MNNNLSLYQLSENYRQVLDFLTDPELDLPLEAVKDTLEGLTGELEDKAVNVAKFLRNMEAAADAIKIAEAEMAKRRKALENRVQWLKSYIKGNMETCGISRIECPYFKLSIQQNPAAVNILDETAIPAQFKEQIISWKIDKTAIKDAIKAGSAIPGAELVNGTRLAIK
ncbi:MAG: siphovirus Gp157 family protein [Methylobacter sp.]